ASATPPGRLASSARTCTARCARSGSRATGDTKRAIRPVSKRTLTRRLSGGLELPIAILVTSLFCSHALIRNLSCAAVFGLLLGVARPAWSQPPEGGPDPAKVRVRIGPLWMNPTVSLTNLGIDQNVFNDPESAAPKQDFTFTATPTTDLWLRFGPSWVQGSIK